MPDCKSCKNREKCQGVGLPLNHESEQFQEARFYGHCGGLNTIIPANLLPDNQLAVLTNGHCDLAGQLIKRRGYSLHSSPGGGTDQITGLFDFVYWTTSSQRKWLCTVGTAMKWWDGAAWQTITLPVAITAGKLCSFATLSNKVLVGNGKEQVFHYDGTTATAITGLYGYYLTTYQNRIFCARDEVGATYNPSTVRWCKLEDPTDWTTANNAGFKLLDPGDGDEIRGMIALGTNLIVFKKRSIWRMTGVNPNATTTTWDVLSRKLGCVSHNTIQRIGNDVIFMSEKGVHRLSTAVDYGDFQTADLELAIEDLFNALDLNQADQFYSAVIPADNQYWLLGRNSGGANNKLYVFNYASGAWSQYSFTDTMSVFAQMIVSGNQAPNLYAGTYNGQVLKMNDTNADKDTNFQMTIQSKIYNMGFPERRKRYRYIFVERGSNGAAGTGTVEYWVNGDSAKKGTYTIPAARLQERIHVGKIGNGLEIKIISASDANAFILAGWILSVSLKSKRSFRRG